MSGHQFLGRYLRLDCVCGLQFNLSPDMQSHIKAGKVRTCNKCKSKIKADMFGEIYVEESVKHQYR